jgi:1,4-alpha-glucan branching enzyme
MKRPSLFDDPFLVPYRGEMEGLSRRALARAGELTGGEALADWANSHRYFGMHRTERGWVFREWAPNAVAMWLVGDFSGWRTVPEFELSRVGGGDVWQCEIEASRIAHGDRYHLEVHWDGGRGERIPSHARYVVQDAGTALFSAQVWEPPHPYAWKHDPPRRRADDAPRIYEAHVGMGTEDERVGTYAEFRDHVLPRIKDAGYDTVQLMAVMEHPYYGSFGYHVSSFFAASSRFGTPDDLKSLVDAAHGMGLRVIMDLVHSHSVRNERDGLSRFDGTEYQYFHAGERGEHPAWGSRCFDYGKTEVLHFLLSNCKFWLEEYRFDGFRFDGVTSMLFFNHGLGQSYTDYSKYFGGAIDDDAWVYLQLANRLIHELRPDAITVAEDVSGLPGCAAPIDDCGLGFDYRMAMGVPDFWFRLAGKVADDDWPMEGMFRELAEKRAEEKTVSYVESHDQALVGGKTFFFTLADAAVYWGMGKDQHDLEIERALALHKMARLATCAMNGGAYLNFMGNEFGHPEWVDFPRAENGWSYRHARRQWSLRDDPALRFKALGDFDRQMLSALFAEEGGLKADVRPVRLKAAEADKVLAFVRGEMLFAFNFHPEKSYVDYGITVPPATRWRHWFDTDEVRFGGQGKIEPGQHYDPALVRDGAEYVQQIRMYLPSRTATVLHGDS